MVTETRDEASTMARLELVLRRVFKSESLRINADTTAKDIEGWDSFTHIELINAVEDVFGVKFKLRDIVKFRNVGDICRAIMRIGM